MKKGQGEDELSEQTLKTIEIVNIADIASEKAAFDRIILQQQTKQKELDV